MALQLMLLDIWGILSALALAVALYAFSGNYPLEYMVLMGVFFITGTIVTVMGKMRKAEVGIYEYGRGWRNVLANGAVPVLMLVLGSPIAYFGSIASITADKFASEIGSLGGEPYFLWGFKRVRKGTSGAITILGTIASAIGALIAGIAVAFVFPQFSLSYSIIIMAAGFLGCMADSVAGIFETWGFGNKETSNLIGAIVGAVLGIVLSNMFGFSFA